MCNCKCLKEAKPSGLQAGARIRIPGLQDDRVFLFQLKNNIVAYCTIDSWDRNDYIHPSYSSEWVSVDTLQQLKDQEFIQPK